MSKCMAVSYPPFTPINEHLFFPQIRPRQLTRPTSCYWKFNMDVGLFLAFFFLLFHLVPLSAQEDGQSPSTCPGNFSCGNLGLMNFPYTDWRRPGCGLCLVQCDAQISPKIALNSHVVYWFEVKSVDNSLIKLFDPVLQSHLDAQSCESFYYDTFPSDSPSISYKILQNITLFKCIINTEVSQIITDAFSGYKNYNTCNHIGFTIYYQNPPYPSPSMSLNGTIRSYCQPFRLPLVFRDNYSENIELFQLLTAEFDLEWNVSDDCYECRREGHMCKTDWSEKSRCATAEKGSKRNLVLKVVVGISASGILGAVILCLCIKRKHFSGYPVRFWKKAKRHENIEAFLRNHSSLAAKRYNYSDIKKITNSFKDKLGQGGYGCVYKGVLHDGKFVAVKVLHDSKDNGEEFVNEVASISKTSHVNIVSLLGFCFEGSRRALVYEFMPNGSLEKFIYSKNSSSDAQLGWENMFQIAVGIARGLEYLHRGCNTKILHFDIKPHNILLNKDFRPKISDFGLAKLCPDTGSKISLFGARGTIGYIAPEVFCRHFGEVSHKSDVYSYGMMVLEMVGGRKDTDATLDLTSEFYFPHWIHDHLDSEEIGLCGITNKDENEKARKIIIAGLWCIQTFPAKRPSMSRVLEMLEGSIEYLEIPPKPFLSSPPRLLAADSLTS